MLIDERGTAVRLGRQLGRTGGEGNAYHVENAPEAVAKVYHRIPDPSKRIKLQYLVGRRTAEVQKCAAWPIGTLIDEKQQLRGFLMPRVGGKEVHQLFGPRERVMEFPGKNWDFLLAAARNCAAAFDAVHVTGAVIGDVNEGNVLVDSNAVVRLIDCDSYQISNGKIAWTCDVGVSLWTPPELQGRDFKGLLRTQNHDLFGLAVLIFKILFLGRHPYAGIQINGADYLLEDAIKNRLYAYSPNAAAYGVRPPPHTFPVAALPQPYAAYFERSFRLDVPRPSAKEWATALDALQKALRKCTRDPAHSYPEFLSSCPWCAIAAGGGPLFFVNVQLGATIPIGASADVIWAVILRMQPLVLEPKTPEDYNVAAVSPTPMPHDNAAIRPMFIVGLVLAVVAVGLLFSGSILLGTMVGAFAAGMVCEGRRTAQYNTELQRRRAAFRNADHEVSSAMAQLEQVISSYSAAFSAKMSELKQIYAQYGNLPSEEAREWQRLQQDKRQLQLNEYLRRQLISQSRIPGIGDTRKRRLLSFGIGCALDIRSDLRVPGFGPANMAHLINWRRNCEASFRFDPTKAVPALELQRLRLKFASMRGDLVGKLQAGAQALNVLSAGAKGRYLQLSGQLEIAVHRRAQAQADVHV